MSGFGGGGSGRQQPLSSEETAFSTSQRTKRYRPQDVVTHRRIDSTLRINSFDQLLTQPPVLAKTSDGAQAFRMADYICRAHKVLALQIHNLESKIARALSETDAENLMALRDRWQAHAHIHCHALARAPPTSGGDTARWTFTTSLFLLICHANCILQFENGGLAPERRKKLMSYNPRNSAYLCRNRLVIAHGPVMLYSLRTLDAAIEQWQARLDTIDTLHPDAIFYLSALEHAIARFVCYGGRRQTGYDAPEWLLPVGPATPTTTTTDNNNNNTATSSTARPSSAIPTTFQVLQQQQQQKQQQNHQQRDEACTTDFIAQKFWQLAAIHHYHDVYEAVSNVGRKLDNTDTAPQQQQSVPVQRSATTSATQKQQQQRSSTNRMDEDDDGSGSYSYSYSDDDDDESESENRSTAEKQSRANAANATDDHYMLGESRRSLAETRKLSWYPTDRALFQLHEFIYDVAQGMRDVNYQYGLRGFVRQFEPLPADANIYRMYKGNVMAIPRNVLEHPFAHRSPVGIQYVRDLKYKRSMLDWVHDEANFRAGDTTSRSETRTRVGMHRQLAMLHVFHTFLSSRWRLEFRKRFVMFHRDPAFHVMFERAKQNGWPFIVQQFSYWTVVVPHLVSPESDVFAMEKSGESTIAERDNEATQRMARNMRFANDDDDGSSSGSYSYDESADGAKTPLGPRVQRPMTTDEMLAQEMSRLRIEVEDDDKGATFDLDRVRTYAQRIAPPTAPKIENMRAYDCETVFVAIALWSAALLRVNRGRVGDCNLSEFLTSMFGWTMPAPTHPLYRPSDPHPAEELQMPGGETIATTVQ